MIAAITRAVSIIARDHAPYSEHLDAANATAADFPPVGAAASTRRSKSARASA